ncbi:torsin-1A-like [Puntigrus tetrazona]|uniref:torsin-1A-like n=1 Tax=Puntigrus tetrazona TaxID=1606681 RepID=UPI001C89F8C4|nr:torsin-1A-like [Puntigrus tetrazona]
MKACNLLMYFFLPSALCCTRNVILFHMGTLGVILISTLFVEQDPLLPFDPKRLEADLEKSLFGQHIASDVVLKAVSLLMTKQNPNKPLVLSFHGTTGTGKNHVAKIIARNIYIKGEKSEHVHIIIPDYHFPDKQYSHIYSAQLKQLIRKSVASFPRSIFIFDEMDKMDPQLIDAIKPFLDYNARADGASVNQAIFIFLSNAGGKAILDLVLDFWKRGGDREEIRMNGKDVKILISEGIKKNNKDGFSYSSLINQHLIDHCVPFLPLEMKHVHQCAMAEMVHMNITQNYYLANRVARNMPYFQEQERLFALKGCKSVRQKLVLYVGE